MDDEYVVEELSEDDYDSSSSDDEIQTFIKKSYGLIEVEDDFEAEVDKVMTAHLDKITHTSSLCETNSLPSTSMIDTKKENTCLKQDSINDELLYDPNMDDDDEKWIIAKRRSYIFPSTDKNSKQKLKPLPNSDAVLNCPACLSLLCMDCQRHDVYKSQYRAMFVSNCKILHDETLKYPLKKKKQKIGNSSHENEMYNPVQCSVCSTEVAVYDAEEIYHFFNVLASY